MQSTNFEIHRLGWKAFEDLTACILRETLGQTYKIFSDGIDGGRDGAFYGSWKSQGNADVFKGNFAVQCKHTSSPTAKITISVIKDEFPKIQRLVKRGLADVYILVTNYSVSSEMSARIEEEVSKCGVKKVCVFESKWINQSIAANPSLRRLVPRLYGLGDLTQVITHQAYRQAKEVLESIAPDLVCFVPTEAYRECAHALKEFGFVMLIGEPASGKTMIANLLALSAADEWDLQTLILSSPQDFDKKWNPDDPGQFFWVDDAFGSNHCDFNRVEEWNQRLPKLKAAVHKGARVVFTSRSYIHRAALSRLNTHKFDLFNDSRVTIEVEKLTSSEKEMILYNHLKFGKQSKSFRTSVKKYLMSAAATPKFLPEVARRFGNPKFTAKLAKSEQGIRDFFNKPFTVMEDIVKSLANAERAALALVFVNGGRLQIPLPMQENEVIKSMQSNIGDVKAALNSLDDSLLTRTVSGSVQYWQFRHPTIRDAFASEVAKNPELTDIYLSGVSGEQMIEEISCGNMKIEGIKLIVGEEGFEKVFNKLAPHGTSLSLSGPVIAFLATRCSNDFLKFFFNKKASRKLIGHITSVSIFDSALTVARRLGAAGLLDEDVRSQIIERVVQIANRDYSDCFIDEDLVGSLLSAEENAKLLVQQKDFVYSNMEEIHDNIEWSWSVGEDVDDAFYYIERLVNRFNEENELKYGEEDYDKIESINAKNFIDAIEFKVDALKQKQSDAPNYEDLETEESSVHTPVTTRSIFDDVDE